MPGSAFRGMMGSVPAACPKVAKSPKRRGCPGHHGLCQGKAEHLGGTHSGGEGKAENGINGLSHLWLVYRVLDPPIISLKRGIQVVPTSLPVIHYYLAVSFLSAV